MRVQGARQPEHGVCAAAVGTSARLLLLHLQGGNIRLGRECAAAKEGRQTKHEVWAGCLGLGFLGSGRGDLGVVVAVAPAGTGTESRSAEAPRMKEEVGADNIDWAIGQYLSGG